MLPLLDFLRLPLVANRLARTLTPSAFPVGFQKLV